MPPTKDRGRAFRSILFTQKVGKKDFLSNPSRRTAKLSLYQSMCIQKDHCQVELLILYLRPYCLTFRFASFKNLPLMNLINIFKTSDQPESLGNKFRNIRFKYFEEKIKPLKRPLTILDIGGLESYWVNNGFADNPDYQIKILNIGPQPTDHSNLIPVAGDATNLKGIPDKEFDIVFSNSVIEHLYTWKNQVKMADEAQRVGKYYFIQTPSKHFPVEPHYVLPFFQYLPATVKYFILINTRLSRLRKWDKDFAKQYVAEIRLITRKEMRQLFPNSTLYLEKVGGLIKSFTAHNL